VRGVRFILSFKTVKQYFQKAFIDRSLHYQIKELGEMEDKFETLLKLFNEKASEKHPVFQVAKIAEETGEAINLVFKLVGFRRERYDVEEIRARLGDELADVVVTTYVCARVCGIDLWKAVERKLDMEIERWQKFE
jgi:NTP pyrophosphatase (non-canonical NTP hydrolase)